MDGLRKALLIGVANAPGAAHAFHPLDEPVAADLHQLGSALEGAGYEVGTLRNPTRAEIGIGIHEASKDLPEDATLLVYFTGHGVRIGDTDYLVPQDARAPQDGSWQGPYLDTLLPADISGSLGACRAGTVLWAIDACRDAAAAPDSGTGPAFGSRALQGPPSGRFALLLGCSAGERSGHTPDGSFFARGLAEALGPLTAAETVHEVYESARTWTHKAAHRHGMVQHVGIHYVPEHEQQVRARPICEGRQLLENWRSAVDGDPLWDRVRDDDAAASVPRLRECLVALVERCARTVHLAQARLPDPWADDDFPVRLLHRRLLPLLPAGRCLSAVEAAAVVAAPFLFEAAWAERLSQAAEIEPFTTGVRGGGEAHRRLYEQINDHHAHIARKVAECRRAGRVEDAQAVTLWLVHRWIAERFETDEAPVPDSPVRRFAAELLGVGRTDSDRVGELGAALGTLAGAIGLDQPPEELTAAVDSVVLPDGYQRLRVRPLAALLRLAALLSADVRGCATVIAEHLAVSDPVLPQDVVRVARELAWEPAAEGLHLDSVSPHPATHAALTETVERADRYAGRLRQWSGRLPGDEAALLARVPARVTDRRLRPRHADGQQAYEVPLLRFHLAQTEVRELLMGERLYGGEPKLALRELYQNAMDACRYRAMRWRYLHAKGRSPAPWDGRISITRGTDGRGVYVDCVDNGVGMGVDALKNTFAEAGSRFERSRAFRREQATWLRHDPSLRLYPNSRFGIGVFSYFMLADEMTITTRQVAPDGSVAHDTLRVDIPGSGSLFRIRHHDEVDEDLREGGTRIRLYLREEQALRDISCVTALRDQVGVAEFGLTVSDGADVPREWGAKTIHRSPAIDTVGALEAVPGVLWWVRGQGAILCDGIITDRRPFGYVLNLTGPHAGELSVDRRTLQSYDEEWAAGVLREGARPLLDWPQLNLRWLWGLDEHSADVAQVLWREWRGTHVQVPLDGTSERLYDLDEVGWFYLDEAVLAWEHEYGQRAAVDQMRGWRLAVLDRPPGQDQGPRPVSVDGYPVPEPGEARFHLSVDRDWRTVIEAAAGSSVSARDVLLVMRRGRISCPKAAPPPVTGAAPDWRASELEGLIALGLRSEVLRTPTGWRPGEHSPYDLERDALEGLVRISEVSGVALGEFVTALGRYDALLPMPLPEVPAHHRDHVCTEEDVDLLFQRTDASMRDLHRPWHIESAAQQLELDPHEVRDRLSRFGWLGVRVPGRDQLDTWLRLDEAVKEAVVRFSFGLSAHETVLGWQAVLHYSSSEGMPPGEAARELAQVASELGIHYQQPGDEGAEPVLSMQALALMKPEEVAADAFADTVDRLREAGFPVPHGASALLRNWPSIPSYLVSLVEGSAMSGALTAVAPSGARMLASSSNLGRSLSEVRALVCSVVSEDDWEIPAVPPELADFRPTGSELSALFGSNNRYAMPAWRPVTAFRLARYGRTLKMDVRTCYRRLVPFRALGALVPVLTDDEEAALPGDTPSELDLAMLDPDFHVVNESEPLTPLDLVSLAAQFGEAVSRVRERIEPYLGVLANESLPAVPDVVPVWQDLIVLSAHLDGLLPALEGEVAPEQIAFAADGVDGSEEFVTARLRIYADLFGLKLPAEEPGDPAAPEGGAARG